MKLYEESKAYLPEDVWNSIEEARANGSYTVYATNDHRLAHTYECRELTKEERFI